MRLLAIPVLLLTFVVPAAYAEQTWIEIRSPHFRVLTDGTARDARGVANEFEQMRQVFASRLNSQQLADGAPLTIVAARDGGTLRALEPALWKARGGNVAGEFYRGWEKQFAIVRLDGWDGGTHQIVYHEYTHSVLHANAHWLPMWLDEGLAEFYAYTRFQSDRIYVGAPSERLGVLRSSPLVPVTNILEVTDRSPYAHDESKVQLFYAEAWAIVHYMTFGSGMGNGAKLNTFVRLLQDGVDQQKAFTQTFGDPQAFDRAFQQYVQRFLFSAAVLPPFPLADPKSFTERKLSPAEADYELGCFHIGARDRSAGRALIDQALAMDPKLAGAHEELGFLLFEAGQDDAARKEWEQAVALDPSLPRSQFALAMSGTPLAQQTPEQLRATQVSLRHIAGLAPSFGPVYVELALIEWREGAMQLAYQDAHKAEQLDPWRAGYRVLTGHILLHGNQPALAASYSRYVAGHWFGPDHDEAVELWQAIPDAQRGPGPPLVLDLPPNTQMARGTLTAFTCSNTPGDNSLRVTLMPDKPAGAKPVTFTSDGRLIIGFSDTLWWGEDHFTACHHLEGLPAVLAYKPQGADGGEVVDLEVRDTLPDAAGAGTATSHVAESTSPTKPQ